jgi:hypothetical protein
MKSPSGKKLVQKINGPSNNMIQNCKSCKQEFAEKFDDIGEERKLLSGDSQTNQSI